VIGALFLKEIVLVDRLTWTAVVLTVVSCVATLAWSPARAQDQPAVNAADLLAPSMFPEAQFGMEVVAADDGPTATVTTTGAVFSIDKRAGTVTCRQRIADDREVAVIRFPGRSLARLALRQQTPGMALFTGGGTTLRINGDSLLMVQPAEDGPIRASLSFAPDFHSAFQGNHNFFDPTGGISFYEHAQVRTSEVTQEEDAVAVHWDWKQGQVFWAGINPPRPFDWEKSEKMRVVVTGATNPTYMYPNDTMIHRWRQFDDHTIVYLHAEEAWAHPQLDFVPKEPERFKRFTQSVREHGLKSIVYCSPHFFLAETEQAKEGVQNPHHFVGNFSGANVDLYLKKASAVIEKYGADGLYFDEMYHTAGSLAVNYYLARKSRALVGDDGPLFLHCTTDVFGNGHYGPTCPTVHTYFDVIYKGEGPWDVKNLAYTRYILGTYNTSNAIGVQISDERFIPSAEEYEFWVKRGNLRFFIQSYWYFSGDINRVKDGYWSLIEGGNLKQRLEPTLLEPLGAFELSGEPLPESDEERGGGGFQPTSD
jgi:hypothetical protein